MKIKNLVKFENESNIINVNFVTTSIEKQYTITIQYFVIEHLDMEKGDVNVETVQTQSELIGLLRSIDLTNDERLSIIHECTRNIPPFTFRFTRPFTEYFMECMGKNLKQFNKLKFEDTLGKKSRKTIGMCTTTEVRTSSMCLEDWKMHLVTPTAMSITRTLCLTA